MTEERRSAPADNQGAPSKSTAADSPDHTAQHLETASAQRAALQSRQVSWWPVYEFVAVWLSIVETWPAVGTPAWQALADDDPRKLASLLDAGCHWALHRETTQLAIRQAADDIRESTDWTPLASRIQQREQFYATRPWLRRVS